MKKFILFNSPIFWDTTQEKEQYLSPLGLGYIATYLENVGVDVEVVDCVKERKSVSDIVCIINKAQPDYIGINIFTQNYDIVKFVIENFETTCECFIGGQAVKSLYTNILEWNTQNRLNIIIGEGEFIIPALVLGTCNQHPEVNKNQKYVFRVNKESQYFPKDISNIFLNRKYLGNEIIINHYGQKEVAIITSRGCAYDCAFCGGARSLNKDVITRIRTEESVILEIKEILAAYPDIQSVRILDDLFLRNSRSIDMANNIFLRFPQLSWRGMVHALSLVGNIEKVNELRKGKCKELFMGIESGSEKMRKKINKLGSPDDVITVSRAILKNGIDLKGYFIYGFPGETKEDFKKTYELASKIKEISHTTPGPFRTSVFQFRPYHGTQLYNEILQTTGIIHGCEINKSISQFEGRLQFNFDFGNYSMESDELLNEYIIKTQKLAEEK